MPTLLGKYRMHRDLKKKNPSANKKKCFVTTVWNGNSFLRYGSNCVYRLNYWQLFTELFPVCLLQRGII